MDGERSGAGRYLGNEYAKDLSGLFYAAQGFHETLGVGDYVRPCDHLVLFLWIIRGQLLGESLEGCGVLLGQDSVHDLADDEVVEVAGFKFRRRTVWFSIVGPGIAGVDGLSGRVPLIEDHRAFAVLASEQSVQR